MTISKMEICGEGRNCSSTYCVRLARIVHHSCLFSSLYLEERPQASVWVGVGVVHFPSRINSTRFHHKKILVSVISKGSLTLKIWTKPFFIPQCLLSKGLKLFLLRDAWEMKKSFPIVFRLLELASSAVPLVMHSTEMT